MRLPILSIIIPMYKVADYLTRCIESLEAQDIPQSDYEIICINDGSPDNCKEIIENFQKKYPNIILLNQENQGVSVARNNGIAIAKGKYILPIDPDDYVVKNSLKRLVTLVEQTESDVVYLGYEFFDAEEQSIWKTNYTKQHHQLFDGVEGYFESRGKDVKDPDRSVAILYKKELLDAYQITYPKNVPYLEDGLFLAKVFAVAKKVSFDETIFYQRTTRKGSATNSKLFYSEQANVGFIIAIQDIKAFSCQYPLTEKQKELVNHTIAKFTLLALNPLINQLRYFEYRKVVRLLKEYKLFHIENKGIRNPYDSLVNVYNLSSNIYFFYYIYILKFKKI